MPVRPDRGNDDVYMRACFYKLLQLIHILRPVRWRAYDDSDAFFILEKSYEVSALTAAVFYGEALFY